jgi:hypothetical protein
MSMVKLFRKASDEELLIRKNMNTILRGIISARTELQVEASTAFARYLSHVGITQDNYLLFFKILQTNNEWVVDALIGQREARLLFSSIQPNRRLLRRAFSLLTLWHPKEIYGKVLMALVGIIENAFHKPDDGYKIYPLKLGDLNNLGKYLDQEKDQFNPENDLILQVLDRMAHIGEYEGSGIKNILSKHAFNIRIGYFDNTKKLTDVIPQVLLINLDRAYNEVKPSEPFRKFLQTKK